VPQEASSEAITVLLERVATGDDRAESKLVELVYDDLRRRAYGMMRRERANHTLQPTALVNEAYLRVFRGGNLPKLEDRRHLFNAVVRAMHNVLTDHARSRRAQKRGGGRPSLSVDQVLQGSSEPAAPDVAAECALLLDAALDELRRLNARHCEAFMLQHYAGLGPAQIAELLGVSERTAASDLRMAMAWLRGRIGQSADG